MKKTGYLYVIVMFALYGCQSAPTAPPAVPAVAEAPAPAAVAVAEAPAAIADPSRIVAGNTGFSPSAQPPAETLSFSLHFGNPDSVVAWAVEFVSADGTLAQSVRGTAPNLPPTVRWDGRAESGGLAPEGTYTARLTVDYGAAGSPVTAESAPFVLDVTPPSGTIAVSPQPYEPGDPDVMVDPPLVTFEVNLVAGGAEISSWRLGVIHPDGRRFFDFISEDHRDNVVKWNGRALNNASLEAGITYDLVAQVFDRYGNVGLVKGTMTIAEAPAPSQAAPVTVTLDGQLIAETEIFFPPFSADLVKVDARRSASNTEALTKLAAALAAVPGAKIRVVGHANQVFWQDRTLGDREQREVLLPLSRARAEAVFLALVQRGLSAESFEVSGVGALGAVAPFGDLVNNWKNRRVEFVVVP